MRALLIALAALLLAVAGIALGPWLYGRGKIAAMSAAPSLAFGADNARIAAEGRQVGLVVIGDSRAAQWRPSPEVLGGTALLRGVGGETSAQTLARLAPDALALKPQAVLVVTGINDLVAASHLPDAAAREVALTLVERLAAMARLIQEQGACALIATVAPPAQPSLLRRLVWRDAVGQLVVMVNRELRARADKGLPVFPMEDFLDSRDSIRLPDRWRRDTLHINGKAYEVLKFRLQETFATVSGCIIRSDTLQYL